MNFLAVAIVSAIVLGHPFNKRVLFDWFKLHSPLFNPILDGVRAYPILDGGGGKKAPPG